MASLGRAGAFIYRHTLGAVWAQLRAAGADYAAVAQDMAASIRSRPLRALTLAGAAAGTAYACTQAPTEQDYFGALAEAETDLIECGRLARPSAKRHVHEVRRLAGQQRLHVVPLGPVSVAMADPEAEPVRTFAATYWTLPATLRGLPARVVDVGYWHKWHRLERAMVDYDLPEDE